MGGVWGFNNDSMYDCVFVMKFVGLIGKSFIWALPLSCGSVLVSVLVGSSCFISSRSLYSWRFVLTGFISAKK